jgi:transketolase C-terminal domain/subunit
MGYLADTIELDKREMRAAYCEALINEAERNGNIVAVDADVQYSMGTKPFYDRLPGRGRRACVERVRGSMSVCRASIGLGREGRQASSPVTIENKEFVVAC